MQSMQGLVKRIIEDKEKYQEVLVFIIQTLDKEFNNEVQSTNNPIGLIRDKIDRILNKQFIFSRSKNLIIDDMTAVQIPRNTDN